MAGKERPLQFQNFPRNGNMHQVPMYGPVEDLNSVEEFFKRKRESVCGEMERG